ncbi:DUF4268 domain-containing protein [Clostridium sp. Cult2]|uniref:DUF4268 domain-containing protein n=1 Tax=Clostridium sp. Cult2 TaxID=2079003 RepID=UPI001F26DD83|nr:DUF4268 domain-containing protein [Clostridium sp. Cult2]MCF6464752.1 DUF4268 domain-containing protein [Clostridium sp. Cult2]
MELGNLERIEDLRLVWKNEAYDFTPWLAEEDNMNILGDTIGIDISEISTESPVGGFSADIVAKETGTDRIIVIENQLEDTNHDHLGKIITYASGKDASIIIWIVKNAREEHRKAIEWLNDHMDENIDFFLVQIELWKIGDSPFAPRFNVLEQPNTWAKEIRKISQEMSETMAFKLDYWTAFSDYVFLDPEFSRLFNKRKPSTDHWYSVGSGSSEFHFSFLLNTVRNIITVECYIPNNKDLFHQFYSSKEKIENIIGIELDWRELPERKASRILVEKKVNLKDRNQWEKQFNWMREIGIKFYDAFKSFE